MPQFVAQALKAMGRRRDKACGIDVHEGPLVAAIVTRGDEKKPLRREFVNDCKGHMELVAWLKRHKCLQVGMESTGVYWKAICLLLRRFGCTVHVSNAELINQVPGNKTDLRDSAWIARLTLDGYIPDSNLLDQETEDYRLLVRSRLSLVRTRSAIKNRITGLLAQTGLRLNASDKFGKACRAILTEIAEGKALDAIFTPKRCKRFDLNIEGFLDVLGEQFTSSKKFLLGQLLDNLSDLDETIANLEASILCKNDDPCRSKAILILKSLPGIHDIAASTALSEIGNISNFPSVKHLSKYAGLVPCNYQSGERISEGIRVKKEEHGRPSKRCNRRLKYIMGIAAQIVIEAKETDLNQPLKEFYKRRLKKNKSPRAKRSAKIALAHKMIKIIWHLLTKQEFYVGSKNATKTPVIRRNSRPCNVLDVSFRSVLMRAVTILSKTTTSPEPIGTSGSAG